MLDTIENQNLKEVGEYLESKEIELIAFDIDNTLLKTGQYYLEEWLKLGIQIAPLVDNTKDPKIVSQDIRELTLQSYINDGRKPKLVDERMFIGIREYLGQEPTEEIKNKTIEYYKDFYLNSPEPYEYALKLIKIFDELGKKIVLHSHAQKDWTRVKVELLEKLTGVTLPFKFTPIDSDKDNESWINAIEMVDGKPENTLVIGDNLQSDILSAIDAGCKHLIWIDLRNEGLPQDLILEDDIELFVVNSLEEIPDKLRV